ncbi:uncharacterized protein LOC143855883 [Tasmannia lanceolata]|uniref:uncharacterized protein LOC143855883 n=1 Tax=Tasmannia lanceolata TaxID=3420 RepID=UPI0040633430
MSSLSPTMILTQIMSGFLIRVVLIMCPNKDWFTTYQSVNGGTVLMGNNMAYKIVGICTIHIKMYDGIVKTLTEVRHVPDLKKNLISLGTLDCNGCKFFDEAGILRVSKGALTVMKGKRRNGLYFLQGEMVFGSTSVSSSEDSDLETTRLLHMRLGHMSERGMTELSKQGLICGQHRSEGIVKHLTVRAYDRVNEGKLDHRAKKCIFLEYGQGVKGYRKESVDTGDSQSDLQQVELEFEASNMMHEANLDQPSEEAVQHDDAPQLQQYNIATRRQCSQVKPPGRYACAPPGRYACADLVAHALSMAEIVEDIEEPSTYEDAIASKESSMKSNYDNWVYFKKLPDDSYVYLLLYIDDMLIAAWDLSEIQKLKSQLNAEFQMKDLGAARKILGMEIQRDRQADYKPFSTPLAAHFRLSAKLSPKTDEEKGHMSRVPYASAVAV